MRSMRLFAVAVLAVVLALSSAHNAFAGGALIYDDGSPESTGGVDSGNWAAVKFMLSDFGLTNPSYKLLQVSFYTELVCGGEEKCICPSEIHIFDSSGVTDLLVPTATIEASNLAFDWVAVDLSARNLVVSGSFYVAVRSQVAAGCVFAVASDSLPNTLVPPSPARSYDSPAGDPPAWVLLTDKNLMFRAEVGPYTPAVGAPVGGFTEPVNKLNVFAPYLALFGVIAVVVVAVAPWKKREN